jgi:hypothetical protein
MREVNVVLRLTYRQQHLDDREDVLQKGAILLCVHYFNAITHV